jgi:hypothetical protein
MSINLEPFCAPAEREPGRDLSVPFSLNGHTYATNGHIAVRVPRRPDVPENKEAPNAEERLPWSMCASGKLPLRPEQLQMLPASWCPICAGSGNAHVCPNCSCECKNCGGFGEIVAIGEVFFNARYILLMRALPGLEIGEPKPEAPLLFRFEGGEGLLMPFGRNEK